MRWRTIHEEWSKVLVLLFPGKKNPLLGHLGEFFQFFPVKERINHRHPKHVLWAFQRTRGTERWNQDFVRRPNWYLFNIFSFRTRLSWSWKINQDSGNLKCPRKKWQQYPRNLPEILWWTVKCILWECFEHMLIKKKKFSVNKLILWQRKNIAKTMGSGTLLNLLLIMTTFLMLFSSRTRNTENANQPWTQTNER